MRQYLPLTEEEIREMLTEIGVKDIDDLFAPIPEEVRLRSCLLYTSPSPRDVEESRMPSSA